MIRTRWPRLISVQLQTTGLAPGIDLICESLQANAQCVGVVRSASVVELSIDGVQVRLHGMLLRRINNVLCETKQRGPRTEPL